jgi:hypothetical protein
MVLWTAGILVAVGLAWFVAAAAVPVWQVRGVLAGYAAEGDGDLSALGRAQVAADLQRLGGPAAAARKLRLYLLAPKAVAGKKKVAALMLAACDCDLEASRSVLESLARDGDDGLRRAAAAALDEIRAQEATKRMLPRVEELLREAGYWRDYPLHSVRWDVRRGQWEFLFVTGCPDAAYAAYITDETSERIDILLFPLMWTKYERPKPAPGATPAVKRGRKAEPAK